VKLFLLKESRKKDLLFGSAVVATVNSCFEKEIPRFGTAVSKLCRSREEQRIPAQFTAKPA
jgi:hypothetical protein